MPKLLCAASKSTVRLCVSSDVMMTSGTIVDVPAEAFDTACKARISAQYNSKYVVIVEISVGNAILIPL